MKVSGKTISFRRPVRGRGFYAPRYSPAGHRLIRTLSPAYLKWMEGMGPVEIQGLETFAGCFNAFSRGEKRLIIIFRHPSRKDPPVLAYALNSLLPRQCRKEGLELDGRPHALFLYGKDVLNWAGPAAVWAFPRLGHIPIQNLGPNREGMNLLRKELKEGAFPVALAPEGQVTYHMNHCASLASGFSFLAQWALESGKDVLLLPVMLGYEYSPEPGKYALELLARWEKESGLSLEGLSAGARTGEELNRLVFRATDGTLRLLEDFLGIREGDLPVNELPEDLHSRLERACLSALRMAEDLAGLAHSGPILERVFRIRYEGMGRIYREDGNPADLPPLKRRMADIHSLEARIFLLYQQIVDVLEYVDPRYLLSAPEGSQRPCEYVLNLLDVLNRLRGGDINSRFYPRGHRAVVKAARPVSLLEWTGGKEFTRAGRRALTERIHQILEEGSLDLDFSHRS